MTWMVEIVFCMALATAGVFLLRNTNRNRTAEARLASVSGGIILTAVGAGTVIADLRWTVERAGALIVPHLPDFAPLLASQCPV